MKLLAGAHHALRANHPFQLHGHQFRAFANHRLKAGVVVGKPFDLVVLCLVPGGYIVEPQRCARQLVAQAQCIEHFGTGLANGDGTNGCVLKG